MKKLLALILMSLAIRATATLHYVDNTATGTHDGSSWQNAWTSIGQITGLAAGDTVYISGGPSGSSQYYAVSSWNPAGGNSSAPITYQIGQDPSHNGTAIFDGSGNWLISWHQYLTISGNAGDGLMHFSLANPANNTSYYGEVWSNPGASTYSFGVHLAYINFGHIAVAFDTWPFENPPSEIDHTYAYINSSASADHWGNFSTVAGTTWDNGLLIHDNVMFLPCGAGSAVGCDGPQVSGTGVSVYNNYEISYVGQGANHQDGFQSLTETYLKVYNNFFYGMGQSTIFCDTFPPPAPQHIRIYNNISVACANGIEMGDDGSSGSGGSAFNDIQVDNNITAPGSAGHGGSGIASHWAGSTFTACQFANNILVDCSQTTAPYYSGSSSSNITTTSAAATSIFVNYIAASTNSDFHLKSTASTAIAQGTNLSAYFTTDYSNSVRQATGNWDIGAYLYGTNQPSGAVNGFRIFVQ